MANRAVPIEDYPRLTRFYGIPPKDLARMPRKLLLIYAEQLIVLEAEEAILDCLIADWPHQDNSMRQKIRRNFERHANVEDETPKVDLDSEAGRQTVAGLGIGIKVPAAVKSEESPDA